MDEFTQEMTSGDMVAEARKRLTSISTMLDEVDPYTLSIVLSQLIETEKEMVSTVYSELLCLENEYEQMANLELT